MQMEVRRTIIYRGEEEWLDKTLAKSLKLGKTLDCGKGSIRVEGEHRFPLNAADNQMVKGAEVLDGA